MADDASLAATVVVKLVLDDVTGEMVSKNELKKRVQKRAKKVAVLAARTKEAKSKPLHETKEQPTKSDDALTDPDAMFKQGFLADVFKERPVKPVITRFPPEPNGYLHLGHAKAIAVDSGFARFHGGTTVLRFDDTNPDEEEDIYFESIIDVIEWLGFQPDKITHSSDNFQKLYELAIQLIKQGQAYICHCQEHEIKLQRGGKDGKEGPRFRCSHAEQDIAINLAKFRDMHDGKYEAQSAFLRMKQDIANNNPQMWDLAAYRIPKKGKQHIRAPEWKIFPTYDFTHCLCDSIEKITHSLCTTEFVLSRESYEWLNSSLGVYEPMQREFGRLNLTVAVMSKRVLKQLVEKKYVRGWDDPRLYTLIALRRRGIPPEAILAFINELGVTTARVFIQAKRFEQTVRSYLEHSVPRLMMVLDPVAVVIEDLAETLELTLPFSPKDASFGSHTVPMAKTIYIDRSDFRTEDSKGYFRLAPGKTVGLLQAPYPIKATSFTTDAAGRVTEIRTVFDKTTKPKAYIQWVSEGAKPVEARVYTSLLLSDDPMAVEGGYANDINPESETIYSDALIEPGIDKVRERAPWPNGTAENKITGTVRFQALRVGYFALDPDTTDGKLVVNRIVALKEDSGKA